MRGKERKHLCMNEEKDDFRGSRPHLFCYSTRHCETVKLVRRLALVYIIVNADPGPIVTSLGKLEYVCSITRCIEADKVIFSLGNSIY